MNIDNFEDWAKNAFGQHQPATDNDAIWQNIEPHLKKKKKRRAIIFFWWGLGLAVLLFLLSRTDSGRPADKMSGIANNKKAQTSTAPGNAAPYANQPAAHLAPVDRKPSAPAPVLNPGMLPAAPNANRKSGNAGASHAMQTGAAQVRDPEVPNKTAGREEAPKNNPEQTAPNPYQSVLSEQIAEDDSENQSPAKPEPEHSASRPEKAKAVQPVSAGKKTTDHPEKTDKKKKKQTGKLEQTVDLQVGPGYALKFFSNRPGFPGSANYLAARRSTEHSQESYAAAAFFNVANRKGLVFKGGFSFRQSVEKFQLSYQQKESLQVNGILTLTVDYRGDTIDMTTGPKTVTKTTEYQNTAYNRYRYLNLPLGLGYQSVGKKSRWEVYGGVDVNLLTRVRGTIYDAYLQPQSLHYDANFYNATFRSKTGLGLWAGYAYSRNLTDRLRWQAALNAQLPLKSVSAPDYPLRQRYLNFDVRAGVSYTLVALKKRR